MLEKAARYLPQQKIYLISRKNVSTESCNSSPYSSGNPYTELSSLPFTFGNPEKAVELNIELQQYAML